MDRKRPQQCGHERVELVSVGAVRRVVEVDVGNRCVEDVKVEVDVEPVISGAMPATASTSASGVRSRSVVRWTIRDASRRVFSGGSKSRAPASTTLDSGTGPAWGTVASIACHAPPVRIASPIPSR
jgi:hypothetical protein